MAQTPKITTGPNDRPRDESIAQTGAGLPDDSSSPVGIDDATVERVRQQLQSGTTRQDVPANPEAVPAGTEGAADNVCRRCSGAGRLEGGPCPDCDGTGKVLTPVGGGG
jgi:hypothetical protein